MNIIRSYLYKKFDTLVVREELSRNYMKELLGENTKIYVTADSALQQSFEPYEKDRYFIAERRHLINKYLVAVSVINYNFPGDKNAPMRQLEYNKTLLHCLTHLNRKTDCHFLFFPQLYGSFHSDAPFLKQLAQNLPEGASWEIVDAKLNSDMQRRLLGMCNLCIASRYHPQIFAASSAIPGICIYYEHKALGFMSALGLREFAFDIRNLDATIMCTKLDQILEQYDEISSLIKQKIVPLKAKSKETTSLALQLLENSAANQHFQLP